MKTIYLIISLTLISFIGFSQNLLNNPESVVYDSVNNRYLVSNFGNGSVIQIDSLGNQDYFSQGLVHVAGLHIVGDTLFAASYQGVDAGVVGYNLTSGKKIFKVSPPGMSLINDITSDKAGYLYVTEYYGDKIFKIRICDSLCTNFVSSGLDMPNGIICDSINNRLLVMNEGWTGAPIVAISIEDSTLTTIVETNISSTDGLTADSLGNIYFSSWATDKVYRYNETFANPPEVISSGHSDPADIFFNKHNNILAVPNFNSNSVDFIPIIFTEQIKLLQNKIKIDKPFPNPFNEQISLNFSLSENTFITIEVYDLFGKKIAVPANKEFIKGKHTVMWNGRNTNNNLLKSGIFFMIIDIGTYKKTIKLLKL